LPSSMPNASKRPEDKMTPRLSHRAACLRSGGTFGRPHRGKVSARLTHRISDTPFSQLDEAATRRNRLLRHHDGFPHPAIFIPSILRGLIVQYFVRIDQHDDDTHRRAL
jgi:hypothetical protein